MEKNTELIQPVAAELIETTLEQFFKGSYAKHGSGETIKQVLHLWEPAVKFKNKARYDQKKNSNTEETSLGPGGKISADKSLEEVLNTLDSQNKMRVQLLTT